MRTRPRHPYTDALLHSRLGMAERGVDLVAIPGESPGGRVVARGMPVLAALPVRDRRVQGRRRSPRCAWSTVT